MNSSRGTEGEAGGQDKGRRRLSVADDVARLAVKGQGPTAIAKALGVGVATVHRRLAEMRGASSAVHPVAKS